MFRFFQKKDQGSANTGTVCEDAPTPRRKDSSWAKLKATLSRTRDRILSNIKDIYSKSILDNQDQEKIEDALLQADCGFEATEEIFAHLQTAGGQGKSLHQLLRDVLIEKAAPLEKEFRIDHKPTVILICGVNGAGKTTTIGKLAHLCRQKKKNVILASGDTFRAAAREQLSRWAQRNDATLIAQEKGDPASIVYDAIQSAKAKNTDVVIADTAGRLSTQTHLMAELKKVHRTAEKALGEEVHEKILIIDGTMGQNVLHQIEKFQEAVGGLSGLIVTKLDGTTKGGTIVAIAKKFQIPIYFIGIGEKSTDIAPFRASAYVDALLGRDPN